MHRTQKDGKVPLTRREHVNHAFEGHWTIVSLLEISRVTWIIIEMWTSDKMVKYLSLAAKNV